MAIDAVAVEEWLESHTDWAQDYFLRKVDIALVNKWLILHGFNTIQDYISTRRESLSQDSSGQTSPDLRNTDGAFFAEKEGRIVRSNSKKYLRQDFARSRLRGMFRTCEAGEASSLEHRRSSLKGMRQFLSLPPTSMSLLSLLIQSKVRLPRYASIDEQLKRQLRRANERDFFLEIVRDIAHDLDLRSLTGRILLNLCILLDADRSSLFFVEGTKGKQTLVSKVFDIYTGTSCLPTSRGDNVMRVPWGQGIIGHVASTGETVNITNASQDPRYKDDADKIAGYTADSLLCMPIRNAEGDVMGVAQVCNKCSPPNGFGRDEEKMMETYLAFCGLAISNAQAMEAYTREYDRNRALLEVVHDLFEEQTSLDGVVSKIMNRAQTLLRCERCVVLLKHHSEDGGEPKPGFSRVFDLNQSNGENSSKNGKYEKVPKADKIAEIVAATGETVNIADVRSDGRIDFENGQSNYLGPNTKSILCKPIRNANLLTIGVAQLINKVSGRAFDENDEQLFEAFTLFCGLGISNCMLYDQMSRSAAKQAVALEVLSYHATAPVEDVTAVKGQPIPAASSWKLERLDFNDFSLNTDQMVLAGARMFKDMGLQDAFHIQDETLMRWLMTVRKNYRNVAYHNWRHAFNVCQVMFSLLSTCDTKTHLRPLDWLALIVASLCHDLDHRGTNNAFQAKSSSPLSQLYGTQATLEHHHFNHAVIILNSEGHNIFSNMSSQDYSEVMKLLKDAILATDISKHIQVRQKFFPLVESGMFDWEEPEQIDLLRSVLMTACDIATITKPWPVQRKAADLVVAEFLAQGDKERTMLKIQPQALMDRERQDELPRLQMEWIDGICLPLYKTLAKLSPRMKTFYEGVLENRAHWELLDSRRFVKGTVKETDV